MGKSRFYATRGVSGRPERLGLGFARLQCVAAYLPIPFVLSIVETHVR